MGSYNTTKTMFKNILMALAAVSVYAAQETADPAETSASDSCEDDAAASDCGVPEWQNACDDAPKIDCICNNVTSCADECAEFYEWLADNESDIRDYLSSTEEACVEKLYCDNNQ